MRTYGIEIEITAIQGMTQENLAQALRNGGVNAESERYNHETRDHWKVTTDSSCGWEVVSPILKGDEGLTQIKQVLSILKEAGAKVNSQCGIHVHYDIRDLSVDHVKRFLTSYGNNETLIDLIQPQSRRGNNNYYCRSITPLITESRVSFYQLDDCNTVEDLANKLAGGSRYYKVNLMSYARYGTMEVRHHCGTLNYERIANWIKFNLLLIHNTKESVIPGSVGNYMTRLNNIVRFERTPQTSQLTLKQVKERVYRAYGVSNTKELKRAIAVTGDLRKKATWLTLLSQVGSDKLEGITIDTEAIKEQFKRTSAICRTYHELLSA